MTISGGGKTGVFQIDSGVTANLSGLTIADGNSGSDSGGGLSNNGGTTTLTDCTFSGNHSTNLGGAIFTSGGNLSLSNCTLASNTAGISGGAIDAQGPVTVTSSTFADNQATSGGGAIDNYSNAYTMKIGDSILAGNSCPNFGPNVANGVVSLGHNLVGDADDSSGWVASDLTGTGSNPLNPLLAPLGNYGGPTQTMALLPGSPAIGKGTSGAGLPTTDQRGLPLNSPSPDIGAFQTNPLVVNTPLDGTGSPSGDLNLRQAVNLANALGGNEAITFDPTVFAAAQTITLDGTQLELSNTTGTETITGPAAGVTISGNKSCTVFQIDSGVTANLSGLTITDGNTAYGSGGGLYNDGGTTTLTDCTFSGNRAGNLGGAIFTSGGNLSLGNCTLASNTAGTSGGAIDAQGPVTVTSSTFSGNQTTSGGGAIDNYLNDYTVKIGDSILAGNSCPFGPNVSNGVVSLGHNLVGNTDGSSGWVASDLTGTGSNPLNPLLAPLGNYGGPTPTMALLPGSPAIGGGDSTLAPATDQRGLTRFGPTDIGAFEYQFKVTNNNDSGSGSLRQAIANANSTTGANTVVFLPTVTGTITLTSGQLELSNTTGTETITGPAGGVTISGGGKTGVFQIDSGVTANLSGLTIADGNSGSDSGGGLSNNGGTTTLTDCTFSGNHSTNLGGAIFTSGGNLSLSNCTLASNTAGISGGAIDAQGPVTVTSSTFADNQATSGGGAIDNYSNAYTVKIGDSILAGNSCPNFGPNVANGVVSLGHNLVGDADDSSGWVASDLTGTGSNPLNPLLAPPGNYGGPTQTMALLPGSPAIGQGGSGAGIPGFDQRGEPRAGHIDIGAFQSQGFMLKVVAGGTPQSAAVGRAFSNALAVTVTANNPVEPVNGGIVSFAATPVGGAAATLSDAAASIAGGVASVTATANSSMGTYLVSATASGAAPAGAFVLTNTPATKLGQTPPGNVVQQFDNLASLRAAIDYANSHPGPDTITFDPAPSRRARRTIKLRGGPLVLTNPATTTINGPGARRLTIQSDGKSRVFDIEGGSLALSGVTITGGNAGTGDGGGILNDGGTLRLDHVVLRGNRARVGGGLFNDGSATLTDVVLRGNTARIGSGMFNTRSATLSRLDLSGSASTGQTLVDDLKGKVVAAGRRRH